MNPAVIGNLDRSTLKQSGELVVAPTLDRLQVQVQAVLYRLGFRTSMNSNRCDPSRLRIMHSS